MILVALVSFSSGTQGSAHDGPIAVRCIECHTRLPLSGVAAPLRLETGDICLGCHGRYHGDELGSHPVNRIPSMRVPSDMLLDENGKMACITCHNFHGEYLDDTGEKLYYLRRSPGRDFCFSCHGTL